MISENVVRIWFRIFIASFHDGFKGITFCFDRVAAHRGIKISIAADYGSHESGVSRKLTDHWCYPEE